MNNLDCGLCFPIGRVRPAFVNAIFRSACDRCPVELDIGPHNAIDGCNRRHRRASQDIGCADVEASDIGEKSEIHLVHGVTIGHAVFHAQILMLVLVILDGHAEADGGIAAIEKRQVVSAPPHAITAPCLPHVEATGFTFGQLVKEAREIAAWRIVRPAPAAHGGTQFVFRVGAHPFGKHAHMFCIAHAVRPARAANDIVVEHGLHRPALLGRVIRQQVSTVKALLLAHQQCIYDGGGVIVLAERTGRFQHKCAAAGIVVRTGRIACRIHHVGRTAIDMALDDDDLVRAFATALDGDGVADQHRLRDTAPAHLALHETYIQTAAACSARFLEFCLAPVQRGTDAAFGIVKAGKRMTSAE